MKNALKYILVIVTIVGVVFASYMIADKNAKLNELAAKQTTVTQKEVTEKDTSERVTLFSSKQHDYYIYKQGKKVILKHGGKEYEFENWSKYIDAEKPTVYATDMDRNDDLEILVRVVGNIDEKGNYQHYVYCLNERTDELGNVSYFVNTFTQSAIVSLIDDKVTAEVSQIDDSKKTAIFAMCMNYTTINYDKDTNLPDGYYNIFRALQDENGQYLKIAKWVKGLGDFSVKKNSVEVQCPIIVTYENGKTQNAGIIKCKFDLNEDNTINVLGGTFVFEPNEEYKMFSYDLMSQTPREGVIKNTNNKVPKNTVINNFDYDVSLNFTGEKTDDFSKNMSDLNCVSQINVTDRYVEFVAKKGCTFNNKFVEKNHFSIFMTAEDRLITCTYDVGYTSSVTVDEAGNEVLKLTFDKAYAGHATKQTQIVFGEFVKVAQQTTIPQSTTKPGDTTTATTKKAN